MLTITRILVAEFSGRNALIPLERWSQRHTFDFAIGTTHPSLAEAIACLVPAMACLKDCERLDLSYHVAGRDDSTSLWPRDYGHRN